jgi:hypothetical protein
MIHGGTHGSYDAPLMRTREDTVAHKSRELEKGDKGERRKKENGKERGWNTIRHIERRTTEATVLQQPPIRSVRGVFAQASHPLGGCRHRHAGESPPRAALSPALALS